MRGYACVGLDNPKDSINIGAVLRACHIYGASSLVYSGSRVKYRKASTDTMRAHRHMPLIGVKNLMSVIPYDCVPVAVDIVDGAQELFGYQHPERAYYIFGAEDATLGKRIINKCRDIVYVPTNGCMNLAMAVNVILYDRMAKQNNKG